VVNRFAYILMKKVGGGSINADEICAHAEKYSQTLKDQIDLYQPHIIIGSGIGKASPAQLLPAHVLVEEGQKKGNSTRNVAVGTVKKSIEADCAKCVLTGTTMCLATRSNGMTTSGATETGRAVKAQTTTADARSASLRHESAPHSLAAA
jgi:hypothetical protein